MFAIFPHYLFPVLNGFDFLVIFTLLILTHIAVIILLSQLLAPVWEAAFEPTCGFDPTSWGGPTRPTSTSSQVEKRAFITAKYVQKTFAAQMGQDHANYLLYNAAISSDLLSMMRAIAGGADINFRHPGYSLKTPLHASVEAKNVLTVELLCLFNASVDEKDIVGKTPLHYIEGDDGEESAAIIDILVHKLEKDLR